MSVAKEFVPFLHHLVPTADEVQVVLLQKKFDNVGAKDVRNATVVLLPPVGFLFGVGPQQVAQQSLVWNISGAHYAVDLLQIVQLGRETAVHAQNFIIDASSNGLLIEVVSEDFPELDIVSAFALVLETVDSVDAGALVISSEHEEVVGLLDFVGHEQADHFDALLPTVHIIAQEQVVGFRRECALLEQSDQVVVLAVCVSADVDGRLHFDKDGLLCENTF